MFSSLTSTKPKKTILVFPDEQKLWAFFALIEVSDFRIESSKHAFIGRLRSNDVDLAVQKLGAVEVNEPTFGSYKKANPNHPFLLGQMLFPSFGLMKNRTLYQ